MAARFYILKEGQKVFRSTLDAINRLAETEANRIGRAITVYSHAAPPSAAKPKPRRRKATATPKKRALGALTRNPGRKVAPKRKTRPRGADGRFR